MHIELCLRKAHTQKPLVARLYFFYKFTIWNNKIIEWIICLEYLGIDDRVALNLFRLCLYIRTGFSHKTPSSSPQEGWAGGQANEVSAQQKTSALNL